MQSYTTLEHVRQLVSPHASLKPSSRNVRYDMLVNGKADTGADHLGRFIRWAFGEPGDWGLKCESAGLLMVERSPALALAT